jgi:hypothetical protein
MRLWSIHPRYLDRQGLLACWREALLAQKVLRGRTNGYRNHPQLERFKRSEDPLAAIGEYLYRLWEEAYARGYKFDGEKILRVPENGPGRRIPVNTGQLEYEFEHLKTKLDSRDPALLLRLEWVFRVEPHPLFRARKGGIEPWERA